MKDRWWQPALAAVTMCAIVVAPVTAKADNGGVGFWLPGTMGSLSAVPGQPGMSYTFQYIHLDAVAGGGKAIQNNANIVAGLHAKADVGVFLPTYTFATPVLGDRCGDRARQCRRRYCCDADRAAGQRDFRLGLRQQSHLGRRVLHRRA